MFDGSAPRLPRPGRRTRSSRADGHGVNERPERSASKDKPDSGRPDAWFAKGHPTTQQSWRRESSEVSSTEYPPAILIAVRVGHTSPRQHISGGMALNIPNSWLLNGGDWHQHAAWFATTAETLLPSNITDEATYGRLLDLLGRAGLRDARRGLRQLDHPDGWNRSRIWAATHERAIIEWAWEKLMRQGGMSSDRERAPFDALQVAQWLGYPGQWLRLHWWAWRISRVLDGEQREIWNGWRSKWTPWP